MSSFASFNRVLSSLHDAALDPLHWETAVVLMEEALGTKGNTMMFGEGDDCGDVQFFYCGSFHRGERRADWEELYLNEHYFRDERVPRFRKLPDSCMVHITGLYTEQELKSSATFNEMMLLMRAQNSLIVRLDGPDGSRIAWQAHNPVDRDGWSGVRFRRIRRLLPHIRQYFRVRHALDGAGALGASLADLLENTGLSVIKLDWRARIVDANDSAAALLRRGDGLFDEKGSLCALEPEENGELQRLLTRALPPFGQQGAGGSMMVSRAMKQPSLVVHVTPVGRTETAWRTWPVAALVLVLDPAHGGRIDPAMVAAALGLTPAESRIATLLAEGRSVHEIAAATGRKESTTRWHLNNIFAKHGLARQGELVRLVHSLAGAPFEHPPALR